MKKLLLSLFLIPSFVFAAGAPNDQANVNSAVPVYLVGKRADTGANTAVKTLSDGGLAINQITTLDPLNSTTVNLAAGASFTGATVPDLTWTAVQFTIASDQNLIVYVEQSQDGTNWDISDPFEFYTSETGVGNTVQLVSSYHRIRVVNVGTATTTFLRLQTIDIPFLPSLPRSLDQDGNLKASIQDGITDESGFTAQNSPDGEIITAPAVQLAGGTFAHPSIDPNAWTVASGVGGSVAISNAELVLQTGTTANNAVSANSVANARFISASSNKYHAQVRLSDSGTTTNNTRRWGVYNATNGAFFTVINGTFGIATRLNGVDTLISNGSFNGELGKAIILDANMNDYFIIYNTTTVWYYLKGKLLHTAQFLTSNWAASYSLPVTYENINTGGSTTNVSMNTRNGHIHRLGTLLSQSRSYFQQGLTAGVTIKVGAGNIHSVILSGITNNSVLTIYDNTAASGIVLWTSGPLTSNGLPFAIDMKDTLFSNGITITVTGAALNALIIYE